MSSHWHTGILVSYSLRPYLLHLEYLVSFFLPNASRNILHNYKSN